MFVLGPCDSAGVQVNTPVDGSMLAPSGAEGRLKSRALGGRSASLPINAKRRVSPSLITWFGTEASSGAVLTSLTMTWNERLALSNGTPSSLTWMVTLFELGPWASVGVQVRAPVTESRVIPVGPFSRV